MPRPEYDDTREEAPQEPVQASAVSTLQSLRAQGAQKIATGTLRTPDGKFWVSDRKGGFREVTKAEAQAYAEDRVSDGILGLSDAKDRAGVRETFARLDAEEAEKDPTRYQNVRPELADVAADPAYVAAQERALAGLAEYGQGGLREADKQALQKGQMLQGQYLRGQREAALDQAEMRGMRGGAAQLASDLSAQQGLAQALFMQNADINAAASDRALRALGASGDMAQGLRRDNFAERSQAATAADQWRRGEVDYARQQRAAAQQNLQAARQETRSTPGGFEEFLVGAAPVVDIATMIGTAAAGAPPINPGMSAAVNNNMASRNADQVTKYTPSGNSPPEGISNGYSYKNPYDDDDDNRA